MNYLWNYEGNTHMIIDEALKLVSEAERSIQKMASSQMKIGEIPKI
ncbi:MAG: hypothetical protein PHO53_00460 [Actinomycetota bacterium]|nr:hypothetical protein [Actinomycetota bacterium]